MFTHTKQKTFQGRRFQVAVYRGTAHFFLRSATLCAAIITAQFSLAAITP